MIDTTTNPPSVVTTVGVGVNPAGVAVTRDGKRAYVANSANNSVSVIDTASNMVVGTPIPVGVTPLGVAVTPDGKHVYVVNGFDDSVSVIGTANNTVMTTIQLAVGSNPVWGRRHPGWETRLCPECPGRCGDRHGHQQIGGDPDPGGE